MIERIIEIVKVAGAYTRYRRDSVTITVKEDSSLITNVDMEVDSLLKNELSKTFSRINFYNEEGGGKREGKVFILDPIDGTNNFIKNVGSYTISVGYGEFTESGFVSEIGVVYDCVENKIYYAQRDKGAKLLNLIKGQISDICVSNNFDLSEYVIAFGCPYNKHRNDEIFSLIKKLQDKAFDIKRIGPASADICKVAEGRLDGYIEFDLHLWDIAAAQIILEEAGGRLSVLGKSADKIDIIVAGDMAIEFILEMIIE
ncbi:MAG: hypothetical protein LBS29_04715 [Endomicrobium sp.]|nr:hypothetical protein [Endomicrobium sp.]